MKQIISNIKLTVILLLLLVGFIPKAYATHQVSGYISVTCLGGTNYQATIIDYTNTYGTSADRDTMRIHWGDGTSDLLTRLYGPIDQNGDPNGVPLCNYDGLTPLFGARKINTYTGTHTYPGPGTYMLWMDDPDRMAGINNICNSVNVDYYMYNTLTILPYTWSCVSSPVIVNPPVCIHGCSGQCFVYNPGAYSPQGDSLSYSIGSPKVLGDLIAPCYNNQGATVNDTTGTLTWCSPSTTGYYNFVILITTIKREYTNTGQRIIFPVDTLEEELEVDIEPCTQTEPMVTADDTCVVAGSFVTLHYKASATPTNIPLKVTYSGEPFSESPAGTFSKFGSDPVYGTFNWTTNCAEVRANPYEVIVKATEAIPDYSNSPPDTSFFSGYGTSMIRVIGPAPPYLNATVSGTTVCLTWGPSPCPQATGYNIYRHTGCSSWSHDYCETGVPASTGYTLIGTTNGLDSTTFCDSNGGAGLDPGVYYSYVVDATYPDTLAAVSYASNDTCIEIKRSVPVLINVSVTQTSIANGEMFVRWTKPVLGANGLDTTQFPGPYQYVLSRTTPITSSTYTTVATINAPYFKPFIDTAYSDISINTQQDAYNYKVDFYYTNPISNSLKLVGTTAKASSIFVTLKRSNATIYLNWSYAVPWAEDTFHVYRMDPTATNFHFIGNALGTSYTDTAGLINGQTYCYYVESVSSYSDTTITHPLYDSSQVICGIPEDTLPPCAPVLNVSAKCNLYEDSLVWTNPNNTCPKANKAITYYVYYTPVQNGDMSIIATINNPNDTIFVNADLTSIAGCYAIIAVDSFGHETPFNTVCVDNCPQYQLPNVFTPNGDGMNDLFTPILPYRYVQSIDINIYNRWGTIMFHTNNPMINWDGNDEHSNQPCPDGVYYYICTVNEIRVDGIKQVVLHGYVQIIRGKK